MLFLYVTVYVTVITVCCVKCQECYLTPGQKHAYPDTMNEALAAFYNDGQGSAKRARLN